MEYCLPGIVLWCGDTVSETANNNCAKTVSKSLSFSRITLSLGDAPKSDPAVFFVSFIVKSSKMFIDQEIFKFHKTNNFSPFFGSCFPLWKELHLFLKQQLTDTLLEDNKQIKNAQLHALQLCGLLRCERTVLRVFVWISLTG